MKKENRYFLKRLTNCKEIQIFKDLTRVQLLRVTTHLLKKTMVVLSTTCLFVKAPVLKTDEFAILTAVLDWQILDLGQKILLLNEGSKQTKVALTTIQNLKFKCLIGSIHTLILLKLLVKIQVLKGILITMKTIFKLRSKWAPSNLKKDFRPNFLLVVKWRSLKLRFAGIIVYKLI